MFNQTLPKNESLIEKYYRYCLVSQKYFEDGNFDSCIHVANRTSHFHEINNNLVHLILAHAALTDLKNYTNLYKEKVIKHLDLAKKKPFIPEEVDTKKLTSMLLDNMKELYKFYSQTIPSLFIQEQIDTAKELTDFLYNVATSIEQLQKSLTMQYGSTQIEEVPSENSQNINNYDSISLTI